VMNLSFIQFKDALYQQGLFSTDHIRLLFPGFNTDNLLNWQKLGYIIKLRNKWYCFKEFLSITDHHYLIANNIYSPSYISHQEALMFYGIIPEHIVDSVSITTRKTASFVIVNRTFRYYSISPKYFFGYELKQMNANGLTRNFLIADREKAILDLLYLYDFYKTEQDISELRFNEVVLENDLDLARLEQYLERFNIKTLTNRVNLLMKINNL
jgi:predicted transcriptional regulator of viral defense system